MVLLWLPPIAQAMAKAMAKNILYIFLNFKSLIKQAPANLMGALRNRAGSAARVFWEVVGAQIAGALLASQARYYPRFLCPY